MAAVGLPEAVARRSIFQVIQDLHLTNDHTLIYRIARDLRGSFYPQLMLLTAMAFH